MNRKEYKKSMSGVRPSEQTIERIMDMTYEKKISKGRIFKRAVSAALALVILAVGGVGVNYIVDSNKPLGVMVSYAGEFMSVNSGTKQTIIRGLYYAPVDDAQKNKEQYEKAQKDYNDITAEVGELTEGEPASWEGIGNFEICDENGNAVANLYTSGAGYFVADKKNYKNVKTFTVENESEYAYLHFEWEGTNDLVLNQTEDDFDPENPYPFINHTFTLTGDQLRHSKDNFNGYYGYTVVWLPSTVLFGTIKDDKELDVTAIKDKITFTFEYEDGSTESASVNISFDSYGHMQIS